MFDREQHRAIAAILDSLDSQLLMNSRCFFGGGTAMVMRFGEWRVSSDIDFMVSDWAAYRDIRQLIKEHGIAAIGSVSALREVRADRYGIRTLLDSEVGPIKFEIIHEGRIALDSPEPVDVVCGVATLGAVDMVAIKLLANDDRWADRGLFSRDLIDLALLPADEDQWNVGKAKAVEAYGTSIDKCLKRAADNAVEDPNWIPTCIENMQMGTVAEDQLRSRIQALPTR